MDEILEVYIGKADAPGSEAYATLLLPTMPYELFDALDKARVTQGGSLYFQVENYYAFESMEPFLADSDDLLELNALCQKLSELDAQQSTAFEGLLKMETQKKDGPISVGRLIDLAHSTDCCHVVSEAVTDEALGRFYAENGFIPALEHLPESTFKMLNFAYIGKEMRQGEGGVFTQHGYVVQHTDLMEVYKDMNFTMRTPHYQILLEDTAGNRFELPAENHHLPVGVCACLDCRIPMLMAAIDAAEIDEINDFAEQLAQMGDKTAWKLKAVLGARGVNSLEDAVTLAEHLEEFILEPGISSYVELAMSKMNSLIGEKEAELLTRYLNMDGYGQALLERDHSAITSYGLLKRLDEQPVLTPFESNTKNEMEMM